MLKVKGIQTMQQVDFVNEDPHKFSNTSEALLFQYRSKPGIEVAVNNGV
jgi:hypothetical protein